MLYLRERDKIQVKDYRQALAIVRNHQSCEQQLIVLRLRVLPPPNTIVKGIIFNAKGASVGL